MHLSIRIPAAIAILAAMIHGVPGAHANERLGIFPTDDAGRLFAQYNIPEVPVGLYSVQARDAFGNLLATAVQEVTPSPALLIDPITGPPGTAVRVQFGPVPPGSVEVRYDRR